MSMVAETLFIKVFSNGTVLRFIPQIAPPSSTPNNNNTNYTYKFKSKSKDVIIDPSKPVTARIFLPVNATVEKSPTSQLPVILYFHGGGFCIGSTTWLGYHVFLGDLSATANSIVVSIDYRLAPENKLPAAYEDCYAALEWLSLKTGGGSEPWLRRANLSRVFLSGDSAGGNIAYQVILKAIKLNIPNIKLKGLIPIHPFFGSENRTELEMAKESENEVAMNDMFWKLSIPNGSDRDFYGCNFEKVDHVKWSLFPEVLVFVAGLDFLKERGVMYAEFLKKKVVKRVSLMEARDESHVFHVWDPESKATRDLQKRIAEFIVSKTFSL